MDSRSSRLLSGRRVPSRHSARVISRSALAMATDALRLPMVLTTDDRTAREHPGKSRGPCPHSHGPQLIVSGRLQPAPEPPAATGFGSPGRRATRPRRTRAETRPTAVHAARPETGEQDG